MLEGFEHVANGLTLFVIMLFFWRDWSQIARKLICFKFKSESYKKLWQIVLKICGFTFLVGWITAFFYLVIKNLLKQFLFLHNKEMMLFGFILTMLALFSLFICKVKKYEVWNLKKAIIIGCVQGLALMPGVSRLAVTYTVLLWLKISPRRAFQISFLIYFPLVCAAILKEIFLINIPLISTLLFKDAIFLRQTSLVTLFCSWQNWLLIAVAIGFSFVALRFVQRLAFEKKFWRFGIYMIVPCIILLLL